MADRDILAALMVGIDAVPLGMRFTKPKWMRDGLCLEYPQISFFPRRGESSEPAKAICARCIVRDTCLNYALDNDELGIWGGTSDVERRELRRQRRGEAA